MKTRYSESDAAAWVERLRDRAPEVVALRVYTSRLLGADPALVLHGGGNTSAKLEGCDRFGAPEPWMHVKGSGWDLAAIEPEGLPAVRLNRLMPLRTLDTLDDESMVSELRGALVDAKSPTPSVETLLHAYLPYAFVDHAHADAIVALVDQPDGERRARDLFGDRMVWVPYVMPGFALAKACADAFDGAIAKGTAPALILLDKHGIFTFGATARESYERMIESVDTAERAIAKVVSAPGAAAALGDARAREVLPVLRGRLADALGLAPERGPILERRASKAIAAFLERPDLEALATTGPATPDHVLRTKPEPLVLRLPEKRTELAAAIDARVGEFAAEYDAYFDRMCKQRGVSPKRLDPWPRALLIPEVGLVGVGETSKQARIVCDIWEHTIDVMVAASQMSAYAPAPRADIFDVETWVLEQAKLGKTKPSPWANYVVIVSGAASGIGLATAKRFLELGAHVARLDRTAESLERSREHLDRSRTLDIVCDVTDRRAVSLAFDAVVIRWGGVDAVVSNAGIAIPGRLDSLEGAALLRESSEVNLFSHQVVATEATQVFRAQGRGGSLMFNASKSAFAPGPQFGPYSVAKAALVAMMRQLAVDCAPNAIRSNAVNADRIRTALFSDDVLDARLKARGMDRDAYFKGNLLGREVLASDVANAFVFLAEAHATTGAVIPVDGGQAAAFPR